MSTPVKLTQWALPKPPERYDGAEGRGRLVDVFAKEEDFHCVLLGSLGFSTDTICQQTGLTPNQVRYRLNYAGVKLSDYRTGRSPLAKVVIQNASQRAAKELTTRMRKELPGQA